MNEHRRPRLTVILPCYLQAPWIGAGVDAISRELDRREIAFELILVDDGSPDETGERIAVAAAGDAGRRRAIVHRENRGRGAAIESGLRAATAPVAGYMDIDLEIGPEYIEPALAAIESGEADWVVASRRATRGGQGPGRGLLSIAGRWTIRRMLTLKVEDPQSGFKYFRRDTVLPLLDQVSDRRWFFDSELLVVGQGAGLRIASLAINRQRRRGPGSTVSMVRDSWRHLVGLVRLRASLRRSADTG